MVWNRLRRAHRLITVMTGAALVFSAGLLSKSYGEDYGKLAPKGDLSAAIRLLRSSDSGRRLLVRAEKVFEAKGDLKLLRFFELGKVSRTDAVLTRHFNTQTGKERRERQITVSIRQDQSLQDMTLDMAHELTHATAEPSWDPYDPALTVGKYILAALEGPGGEVQAVVTECNVGLELFESVPRCKRYILQSSWPAAEALYVDQEAVKKDFYRVGKWKSQVMMQLGLEAELFPDLSGERPELYSSTGQSPYPVALVQEFKQLNQIACENVKRRIQAKTAETQRSPASAPEVLSKRCGEGP